MKQYENYKPSGVEFIGDIPEHWESIKLKYASESIKTGSTPSSKKGDYFTEGIINWYSPSDFNDGFYLKKSIKKVIQNAIEEREVKLYKKGSILFTGVGTVGKVGLLLENASCNQQINAIELNDKLLSEYAIYLLYIIGLEVKKFAKATILPIFNQDETKSLSIITPPLNEQKEIANFLDTKNRQIEEFIKEKQKQITLLQEQKEAIINQAVTKGLDDSVKMKGSGIEWIGDIPEHWKVRKLKYCVSNKTIKSSDFSFKIALENIESKTSKFIKTEESPFSEAGIIFKNGDILFGKLRPYLVKVFLVEQDGICVSEFLVLESLNNIIFNKFVKYLMLSSIFIDVVNGSTYGSKMPRASWDFIGDLKIVLPNIDEQKEIIKYIEAELSKIDKVIKQIQKEIDLIKEYKISLISEVVTGQIKVI